MVFNHWDQKQNLRIIEDFKAFSNSNPTVSTLILERYAVNQSKFRDFKDN